VARRRRQPRQLRCRRGVRRRRLDQPPPRRPGGDQPRLDAGRDGAGPWALLLLSAGLLVGVAGLARLRLWGVLVLVALAFVLIPALSLGAIALPPVLAGSVGVSAAAQLILPLRMLRAVRHGVRQPGRDQELPTRSGAVLVTVLILIAIVAGLVGAAPSP
jgi:hypothetical protein